MLIYQSCYFVFVCSFYCDFQYCLWYNCAFFIFLVFCYDLCLAAFFVFLSMSPSMCLFPLPWFLSYFVAYIVLCHFICMYATNHKFVQLCIVFVSLFMVYICLLHCDSFNVWFIFVIHVTLIVECTVFVLNMFCICTYVIWFPLVVCFRFVY